MKMMLLGALLLVGIGSFVAGRLSANRASSYANDQRVESHVVEPVMGHPDVGFNEYWAIDWLRSRVHFRQPDGTTIVGHDMLVSAVNQINEMHAELLGCRGPKGGIGSNITSIAGFVSAPE
jgi:hypothetical protein